MAETAYGTAGRATLTALGRLLNADLGVRPFRLLNSDSTGAPEFGSSGPARRAITQMGKEFQVRRCSWGGGVSPAGCVFSEMYLGHQSVEHDPKGSFDRDAPVRP
jgi:hypothetical protein